jgi:hypothetical protein
MGMAFGSFLCENYEVLAEVLTVAINVCQGNSLLLVATKRLTGYTAASIPTSFVLVRPMACWAQAQWTS